MLALNRANPHASNPEMPLAFGLHQYHSFLIASLGDHTPTIGPPQTLPLAEETGAELGLHPFANLPRVGSIAAGLGAANEAAVPAGRSLPSPTLRPSTHLSRRCVAEADAGQPCRANPRVIQRDEFLLAGDFV